MKKIKTMMVIISLITLLLFAGCGNTDTADNKVSQGKTDSLGYPSSDENKQEIQGMKKVSDACAEEPSRCADDSGLLALTQQANPESACEGISHSGWKQICLALVNKDIKRCEKFTDADTEHYVPEHYKAWCRMHVIAVLNKPELCGTTDFSMPGFTKETLESDCYRLSAVAMKEIALCSKTDDKAYCERVYASVNDKSLSVCENVGDTCYMDHAFRYNDKSACSKVSDTFKLACEVQLTGDSQACRQINDLNFWYFCDLRSRFKQMMPKPGLYNLAPCGGINQCYSTVLGEMTNYLASK
jgi:hypothetical protein